MQAAGYTVDTASNGRRALERAAVDAYTLVLLDLVLPDLDGRDVLEGLHERMPHAQVIVLSGVDDLQSKVQCFEEGACDYVTKPFEMPELVARIRSRHRPGEQRTLECGTYVLDLRKRRVTSELGTVSLSTREFALLKYLMSREGETCPRVALLQNVWGESFSPVTNVLDVYVGRLRQKLGSDCIQTVRKVGYAFVGA